MPTFVRQDRIACKMNSRISRYVSTENRDLEDAGKRTVETNEEFREANRNLEDAGRTTETKRKADDAHGSIESHRDRCQRASKELETEDQQGTPRRPPTRCRAASQIVTQSRSVTSKKRSS